MTKLDVLIPVYMRPERIVAVAQSIEESEREWSIEPVFITSPEDDESRREALALRARCLVLPMSRMDGDYARKINYAAVRSDAEWWLLGADDLRFEPGWFEEALWIAELTGAKVIATNDLGQPRVAAGRHATHPLVHSSYLSLGTWDEPNKLYHEGYAHNFVDDEFSFTARQRETFAYAEKSIVEHLHPAWGKAEMDEVYKLGNIQFHRDGRLWRRRQREMTRVRPRRFPRA